MVGQHHRAVRPAEHSCEIDDFQPGQRAGTLRRGFILGHGSVVHAAASFECLSAGFGIDFEHLIEIRAMQHCHSLRPAASTSLRRKSPAIRCKGVGSKPDSRVSLSDAMIGSFRNDCCPEWIAADKHDKVARLTFPDLLTAFAAAVEANDGEGLASLFTED